MALFSLQKLFWLCLTPAPSGSYPSSVLLSSTKINSYSTLATNHKVDIQYFLIIESSWFWISSPFGMDDLVFSSWHFSEWFYILLAMLPFDLPSYLWFFDTFLLFLVPRGPAVLLCRRKTLTWLSWPAFLWLCLIPLYAGGYPFVHLQAFPVWLSSASHLIYMGQTRQGEV